MSSNSLTLAPFTISPPKNLHFSGTRPRLAAALGMFSHELAAAKGSGSAPSKRRRGSNIPGQISRGVLACPPLPRRHTQPLSPGHCTEAEAATPMAAGVGRMPTYPRDYRQCPGSCKLTRLRSRSTSYTACHHCFSPALVQCH